MGAITFAVAGQFNSSQILFGMGVHRLYARSLVVEALLLVLGLIAVLPAYGIYGGACVAAVLLVVNRGLITPLMVCHHLKVNYFFYMSSIYLRPLVTAVPVAAVAWWIKRAGLVPGHTWWELIAVGGGTAAVYLGLCYLTCLDDEHRILFKRMLRDRLSRRSA